MSAARAHEPAPPAREVAAATAASGAGETTAKGETTVVEPSRTQRAVARRMSEAKATVPDFTVSTDVDMEACVELRAGLEAVARDAVAPSCDDMVVKASALALREHPLANGAWKDDRFERYSRVNVGIAVATDDALVVPTLFDADVKGLGQIARDARELTEAVRAGTVTPAQLAGGTFTVSSLGSYGIARFTAVINPPQAAILAVGSLERRAVVHDGELAARHALTLTLTCDHRILYASHAAELLSRIRELLERPAAFMPL